MRNKNVVSLGALQDVLEAATRELRSSQAALIRAQERQAVAQEAHTRARQQLSNEVATLRNATVVPAIGA